MQGHSGPAGIAWVIPESGPSLLLDNHTPLLQPNINIPWVILGLEAYAYRLILIRISDGWWLIIDLLIPVQRLHWICLPCGLLLVPETTLFQQNSPA